MTRRLSRFLLPITLLGLLGCSSSAELTFHDVESQTRQFMGWEQSIQLTTQQEAVKRTALEAIPAPCCNDNSAYTCCCPCNVSRTIWGLSNHLISERNMSALQVREKVEEWITFVNPDGYQGQACYSGGCARPFHKDGCGGMNRDQVQFD